MGDEGLEVGGGNAGKTRKSKAGDAQSDAQIDNRPRIDPEIVRLGGLVAGDPKLAKIVTTWPKLPAAIRRAILALVGSAE